MPVNFHHGPEVVEHKDGVTIVRDIKSAVTYINGTAPIQEVHATAEDRAAFINKRIIVRTPEEAAQFGPQMDGYTIPQALDAIFDQGAGGTIIVNNVFDPDVHKDGGNLPDPTAVTVPEITGGIDANGVATGMSGAYECYNRFGYFPKLFLTPGYGSDPAVRTEMDIVASRLHGLAFVDIPIGLTKQQAVETRGVGGLVDFNTSSARTVICYPHVKVEDKETGDPRLEPLSQRLVGVTVATDLALGLNHSPSNREIAGVFGLEADINFYPSDYQNDTNFLNEAGIVTCMRSFATGYRTYGNRSAAFPTSSHVENFIHARRILDASHEAFIFFSMNYVDRLGSPRNVEALEEGINAWLRTKTGDGDDAWFYGAEYRFDREKNTPEQIADGRFFYKFESHPISVMERITIDSYVDTKFIANALALAA